MAQINDGYEEAENRQVLFKWSRYRVTKSGACKAYALWYGGNILRIANRSKVVEMFRERVAEAQGMKW